MAEEEEDLQGIVLTTFKSAIKPQPGQDMKLLEEGAENLSLDELQELEPTYADADLQKYYKGLVLLKLDETSPSGLKYFKLYQSAAELLHYAPEHFRLIASACDSILIVEINTSLTEEDLIRWSVEAYNVWKRSLHYLPLEEHTEEEKKDEDISNRKKKIKRKRKKNRNKKRRKKKRWKAQKRRKRKKRSLKSRTL